MNDKSSGQPIFDVSHPGATPATPGSKPVIPNQPLQVDPMMSAPGTPLDPLASVTQTPPRAPEQEVALPPSSPEPLVPGLDQKPDKPAVTPVSASAEPVHALSSQNAFFGQIGKRPKGKKLLVGFVSLLLVAGLGVGGFMYWQDQMNRTKSADSNTPPASLTQPAANSTLFTSQNGGFSLDNKYNWKVTDTDTTSEYSGMPAGATFAKVEFAINDKQKISFDLSPGGRGGDCTPKRTDKAFTTGNSCNSFKISSIDKLPETNFPADELGSSVSSVYISRFMFMPGESDATTYTLLGITAGYKDEAGKVTEPEVNVEQMGLYVPYTILSLKNASLVIQIVDKDDEPTQLSDDDLKKVEEVLKTFKLTT